MKQDFIQVNHQYDSGNAMMSHPVHVLFGNPGTH